MKDILLYKHKILEILKKHIEENPISRRELRNFVPDLGDRMMRRIIKNEIRPYYPIGSTSNGSPGYYMISTVDGLDRYLGEIISRVRELRKDFKYARQGFARIYQPELTKAVNE